MSFLGVLVSSGSLPVLQSGQTTPPPLGSISLKKAEYWHKDHLGSLVATTSHNGEVTARYAYDSFGKRRMTAGNYDTDGNLVMDWANTAGGTDRGYTGHEHLDDVGLVHMNGRIFDPRLSIFMQGDPFNQDPTNLQNYNRYAYCYSNPTTCTDPTGNFSIFGVKILPGIFNNRNLKIGAIILVSYLTYGAASEYVMAQYGITATAYAGAGTAAAAGAAATSVAGATASGIAGFSVATVSGVTGGFAAGFAGSLIGFDGDLKAALQGGFSGAMFGGINASFGAQYTVERIAANSIAGG